jgi:hypothetical protein
MTERSPKQAIVPPDQSFGASQHVVSAARLLGIEDFNHLHNEVWLAVRRQAGAACGRSRPWVSEIAPMVRIMPDQTTREVACDGGYYLGFNRDRGSFRWQGRGSPYLFTQGMIGWHALPGDR